MPSACHCNATFLVSFASVLLLLTLVYVFRVVAGHGVTLSVHGATGSWLDGNDGICVITSSLESKK